MSSINLIPATTDEIVLADIVQFNTHGLKETVAVHASGLQGTEKITPWIGGSNGWTGLYENGTQVFLTVTSPQVALLQGANYGFTKEETAAATSLDAIVTE